MFNTRKGGHLSLDQEMTHDPRRKIKFKSTMLEQMFILVCSVKMLFILWNDLQCSTTSEFKKMYMK